jgi:hypothetical protein
VPGCEGIVYDPTQAAPGNPVVRPDRACRFVAVADACKLSADFEVTIWRDLLVTIDIAPG